MWKVYPANTGLMAGAEEEGLFLAFTKLSSGAVAAYINIANTNVDRFDKLRPPVFLFNKAAPCDFADILSFEKVREDLDPLSPPSIVIEDDIISASVWHGIAKEGMGVIGTLLNEDVVTILVYAADYSVKTFKVPLHGLREALVSADIISN